MCDPLHTKYCVIWFSCLRAIKNDVTQYCRGIQFKTQTCIFLKSTENLIKALVEVNTYCKLNEQRPLLSHPTVFYMLLLPHEKLTPCLEPPVTQSCPKHTLQTQILYTNFTITLHCLIFGVMGMWSSRAKASWGQERWGFFLCWHKHYAVVNLHYFFLSDELHRNSRTGFTPLYSKLYLLSHKHTCSLSFCLGNCTPLGNSRFKNN